MQHCRALILFCLLCISGCSDAIKLANYDVEDAPVPSSSSDQLVQEAPELLSAFFGFDSEAPLVANFFVCRGARGRDASPVVFPTEIDLETLHVADFTVLRADGSKGEVFCVTPAPAFDRSELRTILILGNYGSTDNQPVKVEVSGNLLSADNRINYQGKTVSVVPLEDGPSMILAEVVPRAEWELGKEPTFFPFGGGSGCPEGTRQIVRVTWNGGITKPGGREVDDLERRRYAVSIRDSNGHVSVVAPFALGDLQDGDNNHKLCLDVEGTPVSVAFPEGLVTDPRDDLNPATSIDVQPPDGGNSPFKGEKGTTNEGAYFL